MDKKHGEGDYKWADGRIYRGNWYNGKQQGEGYMIFPNKTVKKGKWNEGFKIESEEVSEETAKTITADLRQKEEKEKLQKIEEKK